MLLTKLAERVRWASLPHRLLAERAARARAAGRPPLVFVPSCFGTALDDVDGAPIWGHRRQFWLGPHFTDERAAGRQALLAEFPLLPGLWGYDVFGGYLRYLEQVGGYTLGEDLFVFTYDWRRPMAECAAELAAFLRALQGTSQLTFDLLAVSSGGMVVRSYLAWGGAAPLGGSPARPLPVRRVVYVSAPQRGTLSALAYTQEGLEFLRLGRRFRDIAEVPAVWEMLPHPDEPVLVDGRGAPLGASIYDPDVWRRYRLAGHDSAELAPRLARALAFHRALDAAAPPAVASQVIGSNHVATPARAVAEGDALVIPHCACAVDGAAYPFAFAPGDGAIPAATIAAAPGQVGPPWWTTMTVHHNVGRSEGVRRLAVEALIAPAKTDARGLYELRRPTGVGRKSAPVGAV
jgi:hypothetical protein